MTFCHFEWNLFMWTSLLKCKYLAIIAGMPKSAVMMMTTRRQWWRWLFQYWTSSRENRNQSGMLAAPAVNWSLYWKGCQSSIRRGEANVSRCRKGLIKMKIYLSFMMYIYIVFVSVWVQSRAVDTQNAMLCKIRQFWLNVFDKNCLPIYEESFSRRHLEMLCA